MHISYEKLWKLLIGRGLNKTDLIALCGISSRTLSKLSKNQNVNTDTLLAICGTLRCDIADIMEICYETEAFTLYSTFMLQSSPTSEDDFFKTYEFSYKAKKVIVKKTLKKANKSVHIRCDKSKLVWVNVVPAGMMNTQQCEQIIYNGNISDKDALHIIVISGKDMGFKNLDDGMYISWNQKNSQGKHIYLMSEPRFKMFEPSF